MSSAAVALARPVRARVARVRTGPPLRDRWLALWNDCLYYVRRSNHWPNIPPELLELAGKE